MFCYYCFHSLGFIPLFFCCINFDNLFSNLSYEVIFKISDKRFFISLKVYFVSFTLCTTLTTVITVYTIDYCNKNMVFAHITYTNSKIFLQFNVKVPVRWVVQLANTNCLLLSDRRNDYCHHHTLQDDFLRVFEHGILLIRVYSTGLGLPTSTRLLHDLLPWVRSENDRIISLRCID